LHETSQVLQTIELREMAERVNRDISSNIIISEQQCHKTFTTSAATCAANLSNRPRGKISFIALHLDDDSIVFNSSFIVADFR